MQIIIRAIGKEKNKTVQELIDEYLKRMKWKVSIEEFEAPKEKNPLTLKEKEAELLLANIAKNSFIYVLDENGLQMKSEEFSTNINKNIANSYEKIYFIIGGAFGLADKVKQRANYLLSLSKMTLPHKLVRVVLIEQLYRAYSIKTNHPYHK